MKAYMCSRPLSLIRCRGYLEGSKGTVALLRVTASCYAESTAERTPPTTPFCKLFTSELLG